jgi:TPR repeat protein
MYCDQCGTPVQATAKFCPECGHPFQIAEEEHAMEDRQGTPVPSQEELFKAVIGPQNQSYYLERFQRFEKNGKAVSWNNSAFSFLFPGLWFFYRKMWGIGILYTLLYILLYFPLFFSLVAPLVFPLAFPWAFPSGFPVYFPLYVSAISGNPLIVWVCVFLLIGLPLWPPLYANSLYYTHCKKLIAEVTALSSDREKQLAVLSARGSTSKTVVILFSVTVIAGVLASVLIPKLPQYQQSQNHARREGAGVAESTPPSGGKNTQEKSEQSDEKEQFDPEQIRKAAEQGDAIAQVRLGLMYSVGDGVPKDDIKAEEWIRKAAEQENAHAQYLLGLSYYSGFGVAKNNRKAFEWTQKAAEQGYPRAQGYLGAMYAKGVGVAKNNRKAVEWYQKAAEQGDAEAQSLLGMSYLVGAGIPKNYHKAAEWLQKAVEQGEIVVQPALGMMYWKGHGVIRDRKKACQLWETAAQQRNERAIDNYNTYCSR